VLLAVGIWVHTLTALVVLVILAGACIGLNNTLMTQAVMTISDTERPVASAAYGFVRFIGGGLAPYVASRIAQAHGDHLPFYVGAIAVAAAIPVLASAHRLIQAAEVRQTADHTGPTLADPDEAEDFAISSTT
jgi:MFS family permease